MNTHRDLNDYSWLILHEEGKPKEDNGSGNPGGG